MKLITRANKASDAPARWLASYHASRSPKHQQITAALAKLIAPIDPDEVDRIIGNTSWTTEACDECGTYADPLVQLGQEPDYDSSTATICVPCIQKALNLSKDAA